MSFQFAGDTDVDVYPITRLYRGWGSKTNTPAEVLDLIEFTKRFLLQVDADRTSDVAVGIAKPQIMEAIGRSIEDHETTASYTFEHIQKVADDTQNDLSNVFFAALCKIRRSFPDITFEPDDTAIPFTINMQWTDPGAS